MRAVTDVDGAYTRLLSSVPHVPQDVVELVVATSDVDAVHQQDDLDMVLLFHEGIGCAVKSFCNGSRL